MTLFIGLAALLTVLGTGVLIWPLLATRAPKNAPVAAVMTALLVPLAVLGLYLTVSNHDWSASPVVADAPATAAPAMTQAIGDLEARLRNTPEDLEGWLLLGRSKVQVEDFAGAERAYATALTLSNDQSIDAKLGVAEAKLLQDSSSAGAEAGRLVEEALAVEPDNPKALWYGGLVALTRDDLDSVANRWGRLLQMNPPEPVREAITRQLTALGIASSTPSPAASGGAAIEVTIELDERMAAQVRDGAPLFLVARDTGDAGPPVAVVRRQVTQFPVTLSISDADAMIPGRSIRELDPARLIARIANSGDPVARPGDIYGEVIIAPQNLDAPVTLTIERTVQP